jgi:hypothetical protein
VSSRHLDTIDDHMGVVNNERVVARVGSAFSDVRDVIQVRLEKGEKIELLAPPSPDSPWCKVAPPSGEFRWIFSKFVDRDAATDVAEDEPGYQRESADEAEPAAGRPGVRLAGGQQGIEPEPRAAVGQPPTPDISSPQACERELARIDLELSAMVVEETTAWSFVELRRRAEAVLSAAQTPAERGGARSLIDKLVRFEDIKQRHDLLRRAPDQAPAAALARPYEDPRFDGVGRLAPVISQRPGAPQFALVNGANAVVSFLTPAPGVNLRPYVDKVVGVNGQRGYMTDLGRQHINVQRVTLVDVERR